MAWGLQAALERMGQMGFYPIGTQQWEMVMEMVHKAETNQGRFYVYVGGVEAGYIQYQVLPSGNLNANGTLVYDAFRDQKLGTPLFERLVAYARGLGVKMVPTCPYVLKMLERHPELADVWAHDGV